MRMFVLHVAVPAKVELDADFTLEVYMKEQEQQATTRATRITETTRTTRTT